jgi:hypothetical protein
MREITLFCEDTFHEKFVGRLIERLGAEYEIEISVRILSAHGGLPRMKSELRGFLRDLSRQRAALPDAIIVVVDANCLGHNERKSQMEDDLKKFPSFERIVSFAIPDPHIERWMLVDPVAFKAVFGRGCTLPTVKCAKDE